MRLKSIPLITAVLLGLVIPLSGGFMLLNFHIGLISIPVHSMMETTGAVMALSTATLIFLTQSKTYRLSHFHYSSLALIAMGTIDLFHAMVYPGEVFVWLHSLAMLVGGLIFLSVWAPQYHLDQRDYFLLPFITIIASIGLSVIYINNPEWIPTMLIDKAFSPIAIWMNIIAGIAFSIASLRFALSYWQDEHVDDILFTGHTLLFGVSGILFATSSLWDLSWWFWHILRIIAYFIALSYTVLLYLRNMNDLIEKDADLAYVNKMLQNNLAITKDYKKALEAGSIVSKADLTGKITYVNQNFCRLTGYKEEELLGRPHNILRHKNTPKELYHDMWKTIQSGDIWKGMVKNIKKNRNIFYTNITVVPLLDESGKALEYLAFREDITELVQSKEELRYSFYTDMLTSLGNRFKLLNDLKNAREQAVGLIDIDSFSQVNDFYGQKIGDEVISKVADLLFQHVATSKHYRVYRTHGDEFALSCELSIIDRTKFIQKMIEVMQSIKKEEFLISGNEINLSTTGAVGFSTDGDPYLLADIALKTAKKEKLDFLVYHESLNAQEQYKKNLEWSARLKDAIKNDRIVPYFQPIYDLSTNKIEKYEALMRYLDEDARPISPFHFLEIAKKSKQYRYMTRMMLTQVLDTLQKNPQTSFTFNLSAEDVMNKDTRDFIKEKMIQCTLRSHIVFEIVESEGIESLEEMERFIRWAKSLGIKIAIDDFGTGYSNFAYLIQLKADYIKIDGSLIQGIDSNPNLYSVVETIVSFAQKNGMQTIAEFVSDEKIFETIKELGIDQAQGYHIRQPEPWTIVKGGTT